MMRNSGLDPAEIGKIRDVFSRYPQIQQVILYGSRAMGNFCPSSDIDLALKGDGLDLSLLGRLDSELDDLLLPYKIDLSIYCRIRSEKLIRHIDKEGLVFFSRDT